MKAALEARWQRIRSRRAVRAWEYRQRHSAKGVWLRLRRLLAEAELGAVVDDLTACELVREGFQPESIGSELQPPKTILVVPRERFERLTSCRRIPIALSAELLAAANLVLVSFPNPWDSAAGRAE